MSDITIDFDSEEAFEEIFFELDEIPLIEKALEETSKLKDELDSTLKYVQTLSAKYLKTPTDYLRNITPEGTSWTKSEYLPWNVDAVINEQCQKHDSNLPQQHHKVQEINDDSSSPEPSAELSGIINHQTEVSKDSEFEGADEDEKSSDQQPDGENDGIHRSLSEVSNIYSKLHYEQINIRYQIQSALIIVNRITNVSRSRAIASRNYLFKKEAPRYKIPVKEVKFYRRTLSSSSSQSKKSVKFLRSDFQSI